MYNSDLLTYSHFTRTLTPDEGLRVLRDTSEVTALKVPSSSDQPSPSFPKAIPLVPKLLVFKLVLLSDHSSPSATRKWYPSFIARLVFKLVLLSDHSPPSATRR